MSLIKRKKKALRIGDIVIEKTLTGTKRRIGEVVFIRGERRKRLDLLQVSRHDLTPLSRNDLNGPRFFGLQEEQCKRLNLRRYTKKTLSKIVSEKLVNEKLIYLDSIGLTMSYFNKHFLKQDEPKLSQILFWDKVIIPISKIVDMIIRYWFGKSLIGVWKK